MNLKTLALKAAVVAAALILTAAGCAHAKKAKDKTLLSKKQIAEIHSYYPMETGMEWSYSGKRMGKEIKFTRKIETKTAENSYKDSQGKEYYYDVLGVKDSEQYLIRSDGYDGFVWYSQLDPTHKRRAEMGSFSETVKTAGKTYENCLLVTYSMSMPDGAAFIEKVWYAKNVGMVKRQILTLKPNGKFSVQEEIHLESHKKAQ